MTDAIVEIAPSNPYGLTLRNRVIAAAGCFGYGVEYERLVDIAQLGAIVTRSTTLHRRRSGHAPGLIETPAGMLAVGSWPNPGLERVLERYAPVWTGWSTPVLLSVVGENVEEYAAIVGALEGVEGIAGVELNLTAQAENAGRITAAVRKATLLPVVAKLPPVGGTLAQMTRSVVDAGADALTIAGSPRGIATDERGDSVEGWLSGPALRPLALAAVAEIAGSISVPIIGCGGIATAADARAFIAAGATAVQIGAALIADPFAALRIAREL